MAVTGAEEIGVALAATCKGEFETDPFAGDVTLTPAKLAAVRAKSAVTKRIVCFKTDLQISCSEARVGVHQLGCY
jgi:hypothetical protein